MSIFKIFERYKIDAFQAIAFNYVTCVVVGYLYLDNTSNFVSSISEIPEWIYWAMLLGCMFVFSFYLIAQTAQKAGLSVLAVASKISMAIPILVGLFILNTSKQYNLLNYLGLIGCFMAVILTSMSSDGNSKLNKRTIWLPILVFVTTGLADTIINYANHSLLKTGQEAYFSIMLFVFAGLAGTILVIGGIIIGKINFKLKNVIGGLLLGIPNYFSIYFLMKALTDFDNNGAFLFPILNIGVIIVSSITGLIFFKESMKSKKLLGLCLASISIVLLSYQNFLTYLGY